MLELLRSVIPVCKFYLTAKIFDVFDPYYVRSLYAANYPAAAYERVVEACSDALSTHLYIQRLLSARRIDEHGDCWNVSSVCAEYLAHVNKPAHLFSITDGASLFHVEVGELVESGIYHYMDVDPYNNLPATNFNFSDWPPMTFDFWQFVWCVHLKLKGYDLKGLEFRAHGRVENGMHVRRLIRDVIYPNYQMPVRLLSLNAVKEYLIAKRYSRTYSK